MYVNKRVVECVSMCVSKQESNPLSVCPSVRPCVVCPYVIRPCIVRPALRVLTVRLSVVRALPVQLMQHLLWHFCLSSLHWLISPSGRRTKFDTLSYRCLRSRVRWTLYGQFYWKKIGRHPTSVLNGDGIHGTTLSSIKPFLHGCTQQVFYAEGMLIIMLLAFGEL